MFHVEPTFRTIDIVRSKRSIISSGSVSLSFSFSHSSADLSQAQHLCAGQRQTPSQRLFYCYYPHCCPQLLGNVRIPRKKSGSRRFQEFPPPFIAGALVHFNRASFRCEGSGYRRETKRGTRWSKVLSSIFAEIGDGFFDEISEFLVCLFYNWIFLWGNKKKKCWFTKVFPYDGWNGNWRLLLIIGIVIVLTALDILYLSKQL